MVGVFLVFIATLLFEVVRVIAQVKYYQRMHVIALVYLFKYV